MPGSDRRSTSWHTAIFEPVEITLRENPDGSQRRLVLRVSAVDDPPTPGATLRATFAYQHRRRSDADWAEDNMRLRRSERPTSTTCRSEQCERRRCPAQAVGGTVSHQPPLHPEPRPISGRVTVAGSTRTERSPSVRRDSLPARSRCEISSARSSARTAGNE